MRFNVPGILDREYRIRFAHTHDRSEVRVTQCWIEFRITPKEGWLALPCPGLARCSPKDQFTKEKGRKLSLARATERWDVSGRRAAWKAYLGRAR